MKKNVCISNKSKCFLLSVSILIFLSVIFYFGNIGVLGVNANPDYICTKVLSGQSCNYTESNCDAWTSDGKRVCHGKRNIKTSYYNRRSSCAGGYTQQQVGESGGDSGRTTGDYYDTENCTVVLEDHIPPVGELK